MSDDAFRQFEYRSYDARVWGARMLADCPHPVTVTSGVGDPRPMGRAACGMCEPCQRWLRSAFTLYRPDAPVAAGATVTRDELAQAWESGLHTGMGYALALTTIGESAPDPENPYLTEGVRDDG